MEFKNENKIFAETQKMVSDQLQDQNVLENILEASKNEYFLNIEESLPKEPEEGDVFCIKVKEKHNANEYIRKFSPNDSLNDVKNFARCKLRKNSDIIMYTETDGKILLDTNKSLKESGIRKDDVVVIHDEDDL